MLLVYRFVTHIPYWSSLGIHHVLSMLRSLPPSFPPSLPPSLPPSIVARAESKGLYIREEEGRCSFRGEKSCIGPHYICYHTIVIIQSTSAHWLQITLQLQQASIKHLYHAPREEARCRKHVSYMCQKHVSYRKIS